MRRRFALSALSCLLIAGLIAGAAWSGAAATSAGSGFVGAWRNTVTDSGQPPILSLATLAADGTLLVADPPVTPAGPGGPDKLDFASAGHGTWTSTGDRTLTFTFLELHANEQGAFTGIVTVRGTGQLSADGNALTGAFTFDVTDPTGKVVFASDGTYHGTRIVVEPMGTPMATPGS